MNLNLVSNSCDKYNQFIWNPNSGRSFIYDIKSLPTESLIGRDIKSTDI